jgi:hypothetical protein
MPWRIEESEPGKQVLAILRPRCVYENNRRMFRGGVGTDERPRQLNVAAREMNVFTFLNLDASRETWSRTAALPRQRRERARAVALKLDSGLDRRGNRGARACEEAIEIGRIQRPHVAGFVKRNS